jgi:hypothetical protein
MTTVLRSAALVALLVLASGCADAGTPTAPSAPIGQPAPPSSGFPAVSRPARIYLFAAELSYPVSDWTRRSRYVLYDDGAFTLQFLGSAAPAEGYRGTYTQSNGRITLYWESNQRSLLPWRPAAAEISGDSLAVTYDAIMTLDDFEDAVYMLSQ